MRKIHITESQFRNLMKKSLINEAVNSFVNRIMRIYDENELLENEGLHLFKDSNVGEALVKLADIVEQDKSKLSILNNKELYTDEAAYEFVMSILNNNPLLRKIQPNIYAETLTNLRKGDMIQRVNKSKEKKMNPTEKMIHQKEMEKRFRYDKIAYIFDLDALNFYDNVKSSPNDLRKKYPIEINGMNEVELNEALTPYFKQEPEYTGYMAVKKICKEPIRYCDSKIIDPNLLMNKKIYFDGDAIMIEKSFQDKKSWATKNVIGSNFHRVLFASLKKALNACGVGMDNPNTIHYIRYYGNSNTEQKVYDFVGVNVHFNINNTQIQQKQEYKKLEYGTDLSENEQNIIQYVINNFGAEYEVDDEGVVFTIDEKNKNAFEEYLASEDVEFELLES